MADCIDGSHHTDLWDDADCMIEFILPTWCIFSQGRLILPKTTTTVIAYIMYVSIYTESHMQQNLVVQYEYIPQNVLRFYHTNL